MLSDKTYVALLKTKNAEIEAFRNLSEEAKANTFPIFLLRPSPNAKKLSHTVKLILKAMDGHPFALGLDEERFNYGSDLQAQREFDDLFAEGLGFSGYYDFISDIPGAVPVLRPEKNAENLLKQLGNAADLDRGLIVHQQRGFAIPITESIINLPPLPHDTTFVVDAAWGRDPLQMQAWAISMVNRISVVMPHAEIVVMSSSFPDTFSHIIGTHEEPSHENHVFDEVKRNTQYADLTYGDWGSTRLSQSGGGGGIPSRIDVPQPASWQIFRADPKADLGFGALSQQAIAHGCLSQVPECWGNMQVQSTDGNGAGIKGTQTNTAARINMHMTMKSGAIHTLDRHETPYVD